MDKDYNYTLAEVRLCRAKELLDDARNLLDKQSYKSANNRAFYAIEKAVRALLVLEDTEPQTHNGVLKQFNYLFIFKGTGFFTQNDYQILAKSEQIRNASDYDDFYLASKEESTQQIENATYIVGKIEKYISGLR
ncbi:MAG: HEPN domain-containing protein [Lachnospiraceae bacterium]|nr:HEPN domain-containing protein [Lachnospiraceae bacterium]